MPPLKLLILDDEPIVGKRLKPALAKYGVEVEVFEDPHQAVARINETEFDIVVSDVRMEAMDGLRVLETVRCKSSRTKVIIISGYATVEIAREALIKGAFDFIAKPFKPNDLRLVINKAAKALGYPGIGTLEEQEAFKS
jgi:DNA-binding NtrC family response regulator